MGWNLLLHWNFGFQVSKIACLCYGTEDLIYIKENHFGASLHSISVR